MLLLLLVVLVLTLPSPAVVTPSPRGNVGASGAATNAFAAHRLPSPAAPLPEPKAATSAIATSAGPVQVGADVQSPRGVAAGGSFQSPRGRKKPSAAQPLRTPNALARLPLPASSAAASFAASAPSTASTSSTSSIPVGASSISPSTHSASPSAASASPAAHSPGAIQPAENPSINASPRTAAGAALAQAAQVGSATPSPTATPSAAGVAGVPGTPGVPTAAGTATAAVPLPLPASGAIAARAAAASSAQPASPAGGAGGGGGRGGAGGAGGARAMFPPSPSAAPLGASERGMGGGGERNVLQMAGGLAEEGRIGEGGFGVVYKGSLPTKSGRKIPVAVKVLNAEGQQSEVSVLAHLTAHLTAHLMAHLPHPFPPFSLYPLFPPHLPLLLSPSRSPSPPLPLCRHLSLSSPGEREWLTEVGVVAHLSHPNLVSLVGYCVHHHHCMLVYPYLPNGSLEQRLFVLPAKETPLMWQQRIGIAVGAAKGLAYLHKEMEKPIIYHDFKMSNILLTKDWQAKLSDFGLARSGPEGDNTHVSTRVVGTVGYAAPEYVLTGHLTVKSDVYAFGVVLLELMAGRLALDKSSHTFATAVTPLPLQSHLCHCSHTFATAFTPLPLQSHLCHCSHTFATPLQESVRQSPPATATTTLEWAAPFLASPSKLYRIMDPALSIPHPLPLVLSLLPRSQTHCRPKEEQSLAEWVAPFLASPSKLYRIMDPALSIPSPPSQAQGGTVSGRVGSPLPSFPLQALPNHGPGPIGPLQREGRPDGGGCSAGLPHLQGQAAPAHVGGGNRVAAGAGAV
ncbi:unnamed protein product [Closterium sp. Naga37s-1]|nr:unnamed protein product [Closterium sp. Naga37s-1]